MENKGMDSNGPTASGFFSKLWNRNKNTDMDQDDIFEEELISKVQEGHENGVLLASEAAMIRNIFEFGDKDAKDIMIHRKQIAAIDGEMTFRAALDFVVENHYSRYPVYLGDLDNIIGVIHIKDVLHYMAGGGNEEKKVRDLDDVVKKAVFIPETHSINTLFTQMQQHKYHMVVVQDEYGQTSGILSMEDILEEIVGNIQDEYDEEDSQMKQINQDHFLMEGLTSLEDAGEKLGVDFSEEESETLNGFLMQRLGRIPLEGEHFTIEAYGYAFEVKDVKNMIIQLVEIHKATKA